MHPPRWVVLWVVGSFQASDRKRRPTSATLLGTWVFVIGLILALRDPLCAKDEGYSANAHDDPDDKIMEVGLPATHAPYLQ
jgi:hypothetical protein